MDAIIMCAGKGERLRPITDTVPKCLVPINEKPLLLWNYDNLKQAGVDRILLIVGHLRNKISQLIINQNLENVITIPQFKLTGTADAIALAEKYLNPIYDNFLVLAGDTIYNSDDIKKLMSYQNSLLYTIFDKDLTEYGTLDMENDEVKCIHEKNTNPTSNKVNISGYHLNQDVFIYIPMTEINAKYNERIITNTINLMINTGYKFKGIETRNWYHVTYPEDIKRIEEII